jgi:hypothetical protein
MEFENKQKDLTKYQYAQRLVNEQGLNKAIEIFTEKEESKRNHTNFSELCEWSGYKTILEQLISGKIIKQNGNI